jgi:hypothetical protein
MRRAEGGAKILGVFRVKNHDFTPKNHIFSNFRGGARRVRPLPLDPPLGNSSVVNNMQYNLFTIFPLSGPFAEFGFVFIDYITYVILTTQGRVQGEGAHPARAPSKIALF